MPVIEKSTISDLQRDQILDISENHFNDGKAKEILPSKLSRTVSAFANADGGDIFVGLKENPPNGWLWQGFADEEEANNHISMLYEIFPVGDSFKATFLHHPDEIGLILKIDIPKSKAVIKTKKNTIHVRKGAQNLTADTEEKRKRLALNKGILSFESSTIAVDVNRITNSVVIIEFLMNVIPSGEPDQWLKMQELIVDDKPTVAGILLFADLPQAILPKRCGVKVYRYHTDGEASRDVLDSQPETVEGHIYKVIYDSVQATQRQLMGAQVLGLKGLENAEYPSETLHEVITNAVIHRDYSIADDVHVRIFNNRIEVESPGQLPAHITVENILDERFARNGQLVRLVNKFPNPPNQDVGEGLRTAFSKMKEVRLKEPIIYQKENSVLINIRHERMAQPEQLVLEFLKKNDQITNSIARRLCGIASENKVKDVFNRLKRSKLIERVPGLNGNKAAWREVVESD